MLFFLELRGPTSSAPLSPMKPVKAADSPTSTCSTTSTDSPRALPPDKFPSSLKKSRSVPSTLSTKLFSKVKLGKKAASYHELSSGFKETCHVHFATGNDLEESVERPETSLEEKEKYHYTAHELEQFAMDVRPLPQCITKALLLPEDTILEQGMLTFPSNVHFLPEKKWYCLLKKDQVQCYASFDSAKKGGPIKNSFIVTKAEDCALFSDRKLELVFGRNVPSDLDLMVLVTKSNDERVLLKAESRIAKRNWVRSLQSMAGCSKLSKTCRNTTLERCEAGNNAH